MSTFSSVVRKPGQKFTPKPAPRRNVTRRKAPLSPTLTPEVSSSGQSNVVRLPSQNGNNLTPSHAPPASLNEQRRSKQAKTSSSYNHSTSEPSSSQDFRSRQAREISTRSRSTRSQISRNADGTDSSQVLEKSATSVQERSVTAQTSTPDNEPQRSTTSASSNHDTFFTSTNAEPPAAPKDRKASQNLKRKRTSASGPTLSQPVVVSPPATRPSVYSDRNAVETLQQASFRESIEHATEKAAAVAELAQSIGNATAASQVRKSRDVQLSVSVGNETLNGEENTQKSKKKRRTQKTLAEQQAAEVIAKITGDGDEVLRRRGATPEELEQHIVEEEEITMGDLCQDRRWGLKSKTEKEMQENWAEILKRRKEAKLQAVEDALNTRKRLQLREKVLEPSNTQTAQHTIEMDIVNGNIVALSREIDREELLSRQIEETIEVLEDKDIYKRINSSTVGVKNYLPAGQRWDDQSTELFYQGLRMFGTDFMMISNMIPGKNRKQVKLKYNVEERTNWHRVRQSLAEKDTVDLGGYSQMTGLAFGSAMDVYAQMKEDEKRLREEDEQRRRDEGIIQNEADVPVQSIEVSGMEGPGDPTEETAREGRFDSAARQIVERATKKRQPRKTNASTGTRRGRQATSRAVAVEGTEERLGTIEEVAV